MLHLGTNHFSRKEEWFLFLKMQNNKISRSEYNIRLSAMNPPLAIGEVVDFRNQYKELIELVKSHCSATILVSSIIPRPWDHDRRDSVRRSYNKILEEFQSIPNVHYITSYKTFFQNNNLKENLFLSDGLHLNENGINLFL